MYKNIVKICIEVDILIVGNIYIHFKIYTTTREIICLRIFYSDFESVENSKKDKLRHDCRVYKKKRMGNIGNNRGKTRNLF